jgi:Ni/Co efflux regulator RcnB
MKSTSLLSTIAVLSLLAAPIFADPPADKGQGNSQSEQHKQSSAQRDYDNHSDTNHGQVVSECNHRANARNMKGQDRKQWVEWCEERGARYKYDDHRWGTERSCYQRADSRNLSGDQRRKFINNCLNEPGTRYDDSKYDTNGAPRGKDVLGKGNDN